MAIVAPVAGLSGCATLSPPFSGLKDSPMTVYQLQNYEPPQSSGQTSGTFPLPAQIMQWVTAGASLLPPGLLPPGLLPGSTATPPVADAPRFHSFRILSYQQIADSSVKADILDGFGHASNFQASTSNCMYPEFGFAIGQPNAAPADILLSFSCAQVQASNFVWPYGQNGLTPTRPRSLRLSCSECSKADETYLLYYAIANA